MNRNAIAALSVAAASQFLPIGAAAADLCANALCVVLAQTRPTSLTTRYHPIEFIFENRSSKTATIEGISSDVADSVGVLTGDEWNAGPRPAPITIKPRDYVSFSSSGRQRVMFVGLRAPLHENDIVLVKFRVRGYGDFYVPVSVVTL